MSAPKLNAGRRERKREQTKKSLLQAAFALFIEKGYDETTIDDIVSAADMAKVTFYYYFRSKEEIIHEMKRFAADETLGRAKQQLAEGMPAVEILETLMTDLAVWTEKNWRMLEVFAAQRFSPVKNKNFCQDFETPPLAVFLEQIILHGQETGEFRKEIVSLEAAHYVTVGMMHEHFSWIRQGRREGELEPGIARCLNFMMHGLVRITK